MGVEATVRRLMCGQEWREPAGWRGVRLGKELGQVTHRLGVNCSEDTGLIIREMEGHSGWQAVKQSSAVSRGLS